jgi:DNA invertase Pin-like site-specific DNA recombinase
MFDIAFIYRRTSTGKQLVSLEVQDEQCDAYCKRNGFQIADHFGDPRVSTKKVFEKRNGAKKLLAAIQEYREAAEKQGYQIHVVVLKQDRLGRDQIDQVKTVRSFWAKGIIPHLVVEGGAQPKTPTNEMIWGIKASAIQFERDNIRERIKTSLDHRRKLGRALYNTPPYGWDIVETGEINPMTKKPVKILVENAIEQEWLAKMKEWREYQWSYGQIAKEMNRLGVPTKIPAGTPRCTSCDPETGERVFGTTIGKWTNSTVQTVMTSRYFKEKYDPPKDEKAA